MKRTDSLKRQLTRWLLVPLLATVVVNEWFSDRAAHKTTDQSFDQLLRASAKVIAEDMSMQSGRLVVELPQAALQLLEGDVPTQVFYRVIAPDGSTVTGQDDLPMPRRDIGSSPRGIAYNDEYRGHEIYLVALSRRMDSSPGSPPATVVVGQTSEARDALARAIFVDGLLRQCVLIALGGGLLWLALRQSLASLSRLQERLSQRSPADLSAIDVDDVQTEVRPLLEALNLHADRLSKVLNGRESFIADASHQMRTPLAEMRTQIDYALTHGDGRHFREALTDVHAGLGALARLIEQMLLLARSDPDAIDDPRTEEVNLSDLVKSVALDHVPPARARRIELQFEQSAGRVFVQGNELLLREMIVNLLDNAILHGASNGVVTLRVTGYPQAEVNIEDDGPGISAHERERVFERFYRGRNVQAAGSGLGLAIARNICRAHCASIRLLPASSGRGLRVCVSFAARHAEAAGSLHD